MCVCVRGAGIHTSTRITGGSVHTTCTTVFVYFPCLECVRCVFIMYVRFMHIHLLCSLSPIIISSITMLAYVMYISL